MYNYAIPLYSCNPRSVRARCGPVWLRPMLCVEAHPRMSAAFGRGAHPPPPLLGHVDHVINILFFRAKSLETTHKRHDDDNGDGSDAADRGPCSPAGRSSVR